MQNKEEKCEVNSVKKIDFFISYSNNDKDIVDGIVASLESIGTTCWYAPRDVVGRYAKAIVNAIGNAKIFLLCLSKNAATSDHVLNEIELAYNKKKTSTDGNLIIEPLCIEPIDLDAPEFDEIMYYIRRINFISPTNLTSANEIAKEIIQKNKDYLKINKNIKKERTKSAYFSSERETLRLKLQTKLLRKFDGEIYSDIFERYDSPDILDLGCGNGDMIFDRLNNCNRDFRLIGIDRDSDKVQEAVKKYGSDKIRFYAADVESAEFSDKIYNIMHSVEQYISDGSVIEQFDVINISMLLLHLKSECSLLRKLRRILKPDGIIIIKDIDDGINFAYPDDQGIFDRIYAICDHNETSGERKNGRQIYTNLYRAGFRRIKLLKSGFSTIGLDYEEKEAFWGMYFKFILGDIQWMRDKYPGNLDIAEDCEWYTNNYDSIFDAFMRDDFVFSLGFQLYTAQK